MLWELRGDGPAGGGSDFDVADRLVQAAELAVSCDCFSILKVFLKDVYFFVHAVHSLVEAIHPPHQAVHPLV